MEELLKDFGGSDYYRAVLQNLFFATLNTEMDMRGFSTRTEPSHRVFSRFRYQSLIRKKKRFKDLMKQTPFINGGLFDCLDDEESRSAGGRRIDMFSDPDPNDGPRAAQARREAWRELNVPDALFFDEDHGLFPLLNHYKFTVEENTPIEQEVALDPELLGKVFENLLAAYNPETRDTARRQTGSYYTPRAVVDYMVDEALVATLAGKVNPTVGDADFWQARLRYLLDYADAFEDANELFEEAEAASIVKAIAEIKVLDPAVGSGAFPMGVLHKLTLVLQRIDPSNERWEALQKERATQRAAEAFDTPNQQKRDDELTEISDTFERYRDSDFGRKLYLIQNSIFGVDIQPVACQIAKLRFFISLAIEQETDETADNFGIKPLPNLETRFVAANTLLSLDKSVQLSLGQTDAVNRLERELNENRERHFHATTRQQKFDCREKDAELREELAAELEGAGFSPDAAGKIARWNPYDQNAVADWFDAKYMFGFDEGFDVVIGNPPYIQLQKNGGELGKLYKDTGYETFARTGDIYQLFYERGCRLLRSTQGLLTYITSNSWLKAEYGKALRRYLSERHTPLRLLEMGKDVFENAIVDTNILIVRHCHNGATGKAVDMDRLSDKSFPPAESLWGELRLQGEKPWSALSGIEQSIMDKMEAVGTPLKEWDIAIYRGVLTGYNDAFVIDNDTKEALIAEDPRSADIIKPVLRGRDIQRYRAQWAGLWLIDTHNGYGSIPAVDIDEGRCCMNPIRGILVASCFWSVAFFYSIRLRFAQMNHSIEDGTAQSTFDLLVSKATRLELVADELLIAIDVCFGQRASMIATFLLPRLASLSSNGSQDLIPRQRGSLTVTMLLDFSVFAQCDKGPNRGTTRGGSQRIKHLLFVIGPIPAYHPHRLVDLGQQGGDLRSIIATIGRQRLGDHLAGGLINPHMQFAPRTPFGPAVLAGFPLALTIDFQAGRIHHQVHRFMRALFRQHHRQWPLATRQSRVVRHGQSQPHQTQQRLDKTLRLAQRQPKQHPHRQHPFNRAIRIDKLSTPLTRPLSIPPFPQRIVQPHRQATTSHQRPIIRRPILNPIHRVRLDRGTTARYFAHRRLFGKRGTCFLPKPRTNLTGEPDAFQLPNAFYATTPFEYHDSHQSERPFDP